MANRERGEVSLVIDGTSYTLCMDMNGMCRLEEMFSTPDREVLYQDVLDECNKGSTRHLRAFFWASFLKFHPEVTLEQVGDLVQDAGGLAKFNRKLGPMAIAAAPDPDDLKALGVDPNPRKAQASRAGGTGRRSISTRGGSV